MKKEDVSGLLVWLLILGGAAAYFFLVIKPYADDSFIRHGSNWFLYVLYFIGAIVAGVVVNGILFELAHVAGAKVGRYEIVSVNILGLAFYKENGKKKVHFAHFDGLTGETKIVPKENAKKEPNPSPFLLFGSLFFGIEIVIVLFAFFLMKAFLATLTPGLDWAYFILTIGVAGAAILFYNIIPFRLDSLTDGYRLRLVGNRQNRHAFNNLLTAEVTGKIIEEKEEKEFNETKDTNFSSDINLNKAYLLLNDHKFDEAKAILEETINDKKSSKKVVSNAEIQIIYINMCTMSIEEASAYVEANITLQRKKEISDDGSMAAIRTYILLAGLLDKSYSECIRTLEKSKKAFKHVPDQRKPLEKSLFNESLKKVIDAHPHWDGLGDYIL